MAQNLSQRFFLWGIFIILGIYILVWLIQQKIYDCKNKCWECDKKEGYSPYRRTGGCPARTGWTYLDSYAQEDFYRKYPFIYPTPTNYYRDWYANRRANYRFLASLRGKMEDELLKKGDYAYIDDN